MKVWLSSDQHFGHTNIIKYSSRPFTDVEHMRRELTARWNNKVAPGDRVYVLGDFAFGTVDYIKRVLSELNGEKYLIVGNHDRIKNEVKGAEVGFSWVGTSLLYQLGPYLVDMSHYPYCNDMEDLGYVDKFAARRPKDNGRWLLHGHCHTAWKVRGRMVNVGVDQWDYAPVSAEELVQFIKDSSK